MSALERWLPVVSNNWTARACAELLWAGDDLYVKVGSVHRHPSDAFVEESAWRVIAGLGHAQYMTRAQWAEMFRMHSVTVKGALCGPHVYVGAPIQTDAVEVSKKVWGWLNAD